MKTSVHAVCIRCLERILTDIAFNAGGGDAPEVQLTIDADYVEKMLGTDLHRKDIHKYII